MSAEAEKSRSILIFGAGPAGMTAAVLAARRGARVTLLEKTDGVGKKLSMTGNGRANLSNRALSPGDYNASAAKRMAGWLSGCGVREIQAFFSSIGLFTRFESDYLYPAAGEARAVVSALREACAGYGVRLVTGAQLKGIAPEEKGGFVCAAGGGQFAADKVILATGGLSGPKSCQSTGDAYYLCERLGLVCTPRYPALVPLLVRDETLPQKTGVRAWAGISFYERGPRHAQEKLLAEEFGEVQFTAKSLSGIPVLQASGAVARSIAAGASVRAAVNFYPEYTDGEWAARTAALAQSCRTETALALLRGVCNEEIARCILRRLAIAPETFFAGLEKQQRARLWEQLRAFPMEIEGIGDYTRAQATAGGVALEELDDDCRSKKRPDLYLAGELVDVDGRCGGYNLQWAFMSGMLAGVHAATGRSFAAADAER